MKIIKTFYLFLFVLTLSNTSVAQGLGIRAGANFATVTGGDIPEVGTITSYYAGVFYQMPLIKDLLYLQPELQYSSQGFSSKQTGESVDYSMDYINVPILAKIYVVKILSFEAGPQFGFNISDSFETSNSKGYTVEAFDPALALGFNINLPFGLSLDARYVYSFTEVVTNTNEKNQVIQAGLGLKF
jgi:hypothetical protein